MESIINKELLQNLKDVESIQNDGRGVQCVKAIIESLEMGDYTGAMLIRQWDGDKTRSYPKMEKVLEDIFGCRLHGVIGCQNKHCLKYQQYIHERDN
jgi:hypothetical protein